MQIETLILITGIVAANTIHPMVLLPLRSNLWHVALGIALMQLPWPVLYLLGIDFPSFMGRPFAVVAYIFYVAALYRWLVLNISYKIAVFIVFSICAFFYIINTLSYLGLIFLLHFPADLKTFFLSRCVYIVVSAAVLPLSYRVLRPRLAPLIEAVNRQSLVVLVPLLACLLLLSFASSTLLFFYQGEPVALTCLTIVFSIIAFYYALYSFIIKESEAQALADRAEAAERLAKTYTFYDEELIQRENTIRTLRHDFKHALGLLGALAEQKDYDGIQSHINNIYGTASAIAVSAYCENTVVNATVSYYFAEATAQGVRCSTRAHVPTNLTMNETELAMLLGNALENCLKGAQPLGEMGYINFNAKPVKGYMVFTFTNNYIADKYEKGAGLGLESLKTLCEKYEGSMRVDDSGPEGSEFTLTLIVRI